MNGTEDAAGALALVPNLAPETGPGRSPSAATAGPAAWSRTAAARASARAAGWGCCSIGRRGRPRPRRRVPRARRLAVGVRRLGGSRTLLATRETEAVNRHVTELLVPADAEAQGPANLAVAVTWAARGDDAAAQGDRAPGEHVRRAPDRADRQLRPAAGPRWSCSTEGTLSTAAARTRVRRRTSSACTKTAQRCTPACAPCKASRIPR